jgi:hypothetical protein
MLLDAQIAAFGRKISAFLNSGRRLSDPIN